MIASGMETGVREGHDKLDDMLSADRPSVEDDQ